MDSGRVEGIIRESIKEARGELELQSVIEEVAGVDWIECGLGSREGWKRLSDRAGVEWFVLVT